MEFYKLPENESIYHNMEYKNETFYFFMDNRYEKYVNENGYEVILDKNKKVVYNPVIIGTYNMFTYPLNSDLLNEDKRKHKIDVDLWKEYGTGPKDPTNKNKELRREIGEIITNSFARDFQKNYYKIKNKAKNEKRTSYSYDEILEIMENGDY